MRQKPAVGLPVIYHDERGRAHNGLITAVWGDYMVNILHVSSNESQTDGYGRQIIRESSVPMAGADGMSCAHGRYCRWENEEAVPYSEPQAV